MKIKEQMMTVQTDCILCPKMPLRQVSPWEKEGIAIIVVAGAVILLH